MIFQNEKTPLQAEKTRSSKSRKINIFPKGLTHGFGLKMTNFPTFFFRNIGHEHVFYDILKQKNSFLGYKNKEIKKSKNCHFSKGVNPWFWSRNGHFSKFFFYAIYTTKMYAMILYNEKTPFEAKKTRSSKSPKINIFPKGVNLWFWSKNGHFSNFFFQGIQPLKTSFMIFQNEKTHFQAIKTRSSKSRKIKMFPKGLTHGFGPKMAIFQTFFFTHYRLRKYIL